MITDLPYYDFEMFTAMECAHHMARRYGFAKALKLASEWKADERLKSGGREYWRLVVAQLTSEAHHGPTL